MPFDLLSELTPDQLQAVTHTTGPCLVVAGAGTGKTKVITHRIAYLILQHMVPAERIVALTFTDKAAREMEDRVDRLLPYGVTGTVISTFHSFGADILKRHAFLLGLDPASRLMTAADEISFLRQHLAELPTKLYKPSKNPVEFLHALTQFLSRAKDECLTPDEIIAHAKTLRKTAADDATAEQAAKLEELGRVYAAVDRLYADASVLSYGDLIYQVVKLFRNFPSAVKEERERVSYLLIDEFQDTNYAQSEVARLLTGPNGNIMAVGDDDQAIYSFRGANINNILHFRETYPGAKAVPLTENFRSTQPILDTAYALIQHNNPNRLEARESISKRLISQRVGGSLPEHWHFERSIFEQQKVADTINDLLRSGLYEPEDIAILVRSRSHSHGMEAALQSRGIPYHCLGDNRFYHQPLIQSVLSFLRFLTDPDNNLNLFYCLTHPPFRVPERVLQKYMNASRYQTVSLYEYLEQSSNLDTDVTAALQYLQKLITECGGLQTSQAFLHFIQDSGLTEQMKEEGQSMDLLATLHEEISAYETVRGASGVAEYIQYLDYLLASEEEITLQRDNDTASPGVRVLTIHKSKGLEFSVVFVMSMVQGRFPGKNYADSLPFPYEITHSHLNPTENKEEEERRLAYVAFTRAKERLYLTSSELYEERKTPAKVSQFVIEALGASSQPQRGKEAPLPLPTGRTGKKEGQRYQPPTFSPSALENYMSCPKKYEYQYVLNVKAPASHFANFGISVHETLRKWWEARRNGKDADIDTLYRESWISGGYENKRHEHERFQEGLEMLKRYEERHRDEPIKPVALEQSCKIRLEEGIVLNGKIDRVDLLPDGKYKVIDYKTGESVKKSKDLADDIALGSYVLALTQQRRTVEEVEIQYLMKDEAVTLKQADLDLTAVQAKVKETVTRIRADIERGEFTPTPSLNTCQYCDYRDICPFRYRKG
ncbi:UvrD-helicase domain-containing protein [Patescibacteria group bacterium]|nr:UvrD-helicase domain-containing protein [Patescibacteria group bacterium]